MIKYFFLILTFFTLLLGLQAQAQEMTFHGRIVDSTTNLGINGSTLFRVQVRTASGAPDNCVLYEEQITRTVSNGVYVLRINSTGASNTYTSNATTLSQVFNNKNIFGSFIIPAASCDLAAGLSWTPGANDSRRISISFWDAVNSVWEPLPTQVASYVPLAIESSNISGFPIESLFRVVNGGVPGVATAFSPAQFTELTNTLTGNSSFYLRSVDPSVGFSGSLSGDVTGGQSTTSVQRIRGVPVSATAPTNGQVLTFNGTSWAASTDGGGTVTNVSSANAYITVTTPSSTPVLTLNVGTAAGTVAAGNDPRIVNSVVSGTTAAGGDLAGTYPNPTVATVGGRTAGQIGTSVSDTTAATSANTAGTIVRRDGSGNAAFGTAQATNFSGRNLYLYNLTDTNFARLKAPDALGVNYVLTLPNTAPVSGTVLTTNASGDLQWTSPSSLGVTAVTASSPLASSGGSSPNITITQAGAGASGYLSSVDWTTFNNKRSNTLTTGMAWIGNGTNQAAEKFLDITNVRSTIVPGTNAFFNVAGACAAGTTLTYSPITDQVSCAAYALTSGQVTTALGFTPMTNALPVNQIFVGDASGTATAVAMAGDASILASGVITISNDAITTAKIANNAVTNAKINDVNWNKVTSTPTTIAGYNITDAILTEAGGVDTMQADILANRPAAAAAPGRVFVSTNTGEVYYSNGATWTVVGSAVGLGGTVSNVSANFPLSVTSGTTTPVISIGQAGVAGAGYLSSADWNSFNNKLSPSLAAGQIYIGSAGGVATATTISGDATLDSSGNLALINTGVAAGTYTRLTVDAKGRVTSATNLTSADVTGALGYTPVNRGGDTMTGSLTLPANGLTVGSNLVVAGNRVSIGAASADASAILDVSSSTLGFLMPRMTTGQRNAIATPATGLQVFNTDTNAVEYYNGGSWLTVASTIGSISNLNGVTAQTQTFAIGSAGTNFNIVSVSATGVHTFNIPTASATARGLLSSADYSSLAGKVSSLGADAPIYIDNTNPLVPIVGINQASTGGAGFLSSADFTTFNNKLGTATNFSGDVTGTYNSITLNNTGVSSGTYTKVTVDTKGRVTAATNLTSADVTAGLGFTPVNRAGDTMTGTLNLASNGLNVGSGQLAVVGGNTTIGGSASVSGTLAVGVASPNASAVLDLTSVNLGFLMPRMTVAQRNAIGTPATGLQVFNTDTNTVDYYNGAVWLSLANTSGSINSLNGLTATAQTFAVGSAGSDLNIASVSSTHTFNIPNASASNNRGLLTSADWSIFNNKLTSSLAAGQIFVGSASGTATAVTVTGDAALNNSGVLTLSSSGVVSGTYGAANAVPRVTVDAKGRVTFADSVAYQDATAVDKGIVQIGTGLSVTGGLVSINFGTTSGTAAAGNDVRLSDARTPTGPASGDLSGTYPNPVVANSAITTAKIADGAITNIKITDVNWNKVTSTPTTIAGYGITDAVLANAGGVSTTQAANFAARPAAAAAPMRFFISVDTGEVYYSNGVAWTLVGSADGAGGTVTNVTALSPLSVVSGTSTPVISISRANSTTDGYLASSDFASLSAKVNSLGADAPIYIDNTNPLVPIVGMNQASTGGAGYLTSADFTTFNNKLNNSLTNGMFWVGNGSNVPTPVMLSGDASLSNSGVLTLASTGVVSGTYTKVTVDNKGRVTAATNLTSADVTAGLGFTPVNRAGDTMTGALALPSNGLNVGSGQLAVSGTNVVISNRLAVGTVSPNASALIDLTSTSLGFLMPRMTTGQRNGIGTPAAGLQVFNTDTNSVDVYNGTVWQSLASTSGALSSLNGLTAPTQTFAVGSAGADFNIASVSSTHTFNIPTASAVNQRGLLTSADYSSFSAKVSSLGADAPIYIDNTNPLVPIVGINQASTGGAGFLSSADFTTFNNKLGTTTNFSGDVTGTYNNLVLGNVGTAGTYAGPVTVDAKGRVTSAVASLDVSAAYITGVLPVTNGGTGASSIGAGNLVVGGGTGAVTSLAAGTAGNVVYSTGVATWASGSPDAANLVDKTSTQLISGDKSFVNNVGIRSQNSVRFNDSDNSNYVGLRAAANVSTDITLTLPNTVGNSGQVLRTDGTGILSWVNALTDSLTNGRILIGNGSNIATEVLVSGDATLANTGVLTLASSGVVSGTYTKVTVDSKGRVITGASLTSADVSGAIGYTPIQSLGSDSPVYIDNTNPQIPIVGMNQASTGGAGYLSSADFTIFNNKLGTATTFSGDVTGTYNSITLNNTGVSSGTYTKVTVDAKGRVTAATNLTSADVTAGLGFTPVNRAGDTMTGALALPSNGLNVGSGQLAVSGTNVVVANRLAVGTVSPNASALLDLTSTTLGFLMPRMTTAQRNAVGTPAAGLQVFNTDTNSVDVYNGTVWQSLASTSGSIASLNGVTLSTQTFAVGSTGADFNVSSVSATGVHTFNIPNASATNQRGLLTSTDYSSFAAKVTSLGADAPIYIDNTNPQVPIVGINQASTGGAGFLSSADFTTFNNKLGTATTFSGDVTGTYNSITLNNTGVSSGTYTKVTVDSKGRVTAATNLTSADVTAGLGFTPVNRAGDTMTGALALPSNGLNVGSGQLAVSGTNVVISNRLAVGTLSPNASAALDISSTTLGFLMPRMTTGQRNGIGTPAAGLQVFNTDTNSVDVYNGTVWQSLASTSGSLSSLNGLTAPTQTFSVGSAGADFNISSASSTHTFNIPNASAINQRGLLTSADYSSFAAKVTSLGADAPIYIDNTNPLVPIVGINQASTGGAGFLSSADFTTFNNKLGTATTFSGDVTGTYNSITLNNTGVSSGTYTKVTVDTKGRVTAATNLTSADVTAGLGFTPVNRAGDTMTGALALPSNGLNVGSGQLAVSGTSVVISNRLSVGTASPNASALVDLSSVTSGFLMPRMTTGQRNGIGTPATGLQVFNTDTNSVDVYNGTAWQSLASTSGSIASLNGVTLSTQTFAVGSAGTDFNIASVSGTGVHSFNIPNASATNQRGLLTSADYSSFAAKVTSLGADAPIYIDNTNPLVPIVGINQASTGGAGFLSSADFTTFNNKLGTATTFSGDVTGTYNNLVLGNVGTAGTYAGPVTVDAKGRITSAVASLDLSTAYVTGTLPVARGGTGATSIGAGNLVVGGGTGAVTSLAAGTAGNVVYSTGVATWASGSPDAANLVDKTSTQLISGDKSFVNNVGVRSQNAIRYYDADNSNFVAIRSPAVASGDTTLTLPNTAGSNGQVLATDGTGLLSWVNALTNSLTNGRILIGNGSGVATEVLVSGDATLANTGVLTLSNSGVVSGTYTKVTVDSKGRVITGASLTSADVSGAIGYTPIQSLGSDSPVYIDNTNPQIPIVGMNQASTGGAGYLSSADFTIFNNKLGTATTFSGDVTGTYNNTVLANSGVVSGTYTKVTVDAKGRVITGANLNSVDVTTALTYTPVNRAGDTMTGALALASNGLNVGSGQLAVSGTNVVVANKLSVGTISPNTSALLDLTSTTLGFLMPRMTTAQRNAIGTPAAGLQVYNTSTNSVDYYNGSGWSQMAAAGSAITSLNGVVSATQTFAVGSTGTDFNIASVSGTGVHSFNIPNASATNQRGLLTSADYSSFAAKVTSLGADAPIYIDNTNPLVPIVGINQASTGGAGFLSSADFTTFNNKLGVATAFSGDVTGTYNNLVLGNVGTAGTYAGPVTVDAKGRITSAVASLDLSTAYVTGTLPVARGGTGATSIGSGNLVVGGGTGAVTSLAAGTAGNVVYATGVSTWASGSPDAANLVDKTSTQLISGDKSFVNNIAVRSQNSVRFNDADNSNYVALRAASNVSTDLTFILPNTSGSSGQVLSTDGAGILSWVSALTSALPNGQILVGDAGGVATARTISGDGTIGNTGTFTLANSGVVSGTYTKVTVDTKGRVITGANLVSTDVTSGLGYTPVQSVTGTAPVTVNNTDARNPVISMAAANGTTNGYLTSGDWSMFNLKLGTATAFSGDVTGTYNNTVLANSGVVSGTYTKVTVDAKGRVITGANLNSVDITTALTYTPVNRAGDTMTGALALPSNGLNVGSGQLAVSGTNVVIANRLSVGTASPNASAVLDLTSTTLGFLMPRMTTAQRNAVGTPAAGLQVYNTSTNTVDYYNGSGWSQMAAAGSAITSLNGVVSATQTFAVGSAGTDFNIASVSGTGVHTFNIPNASATNQRGLLTSTDYSSFAAKVTSLGSDAPIYIDNTNPQVPIVGINQASTGGAGFLSSADFTTFNNKLGTATTFSGDVTGTYNNMVLANVGTAGTYAGPVTVDAKGRITSAVASLDLSTASVTGTLPVARGGTGATSIGSGNIVIGGGTGAVTSLAGGTAGNVVYATGVSTWASGSPDAANLVDKTSTQLISGDKSFANNVGVRSQNAFRFYDADSSNYIGIRSPANITSGDATLTLPGSAGSAGQVLSTNGAGGILSWVSALTSALPSGQVLVGDAGGTATARTISGDGTIGNTGTFTLASIATAGTYSGPVTIDAKGRVTSAAASLDLSTASVTGTLPVARGGTGLTGGTSGGIPYYNSATTMASSGVLAANSVVLGNGAGNAPTSATGTGAQVLRLVAGVPSFGQIDLESSSVVANHNAREFYMGPVSGTGATTPTFRTIVSSDVSTVAFVNGGNSFAGTARIGTTDNNAFNIVTNNINRAIFSAAGALSISTDVTIGVSGTTVPTTAANLEVNGQGFSRVVTSTSATPLAWDTNSGNTMRWTLNTGTVVVNMSNVKPGASYMLVVKGSGTGTVTINCSATTSGHVVAKYVPGNGNRVASNGTNSKSVYTVVYDGEECLATWITGF